MVTAPTITMRMAITMATMGRLMKNLEWLQLLSLPERSADPYSRAVSTFCSPSVTTFLPLALAFDNPHRIHTLADFHRPQRDLFVAPYHSHLISPCSSYSSLWNQQGTRSCFSRGTHSPKLARRNMLFGLGKCANQLNAPRRDVHLPIGQQQSSLARVDRSVREDQVEWRRIGWHTC